MVVGAEERAHVRDAILGAPLRTDPSPYVFVENVFSARFYDTMVRLFPSDDAFVPWRNTGRPPEFFGNYEQRGQLALPDGAEGLPSEQREFWHALSAYLCGSEFAALLLTRFESHYRSQFGAAMDEPAFVETLRPGLVVNTHKPHYYLGPHTDRYEKLVTCVFYMAERTGLDHLGTTIYRPLDREMRCRGFFHHDPARFEVAETIPYRPNAMLVFARTDVFFHGVHRLTPSALQGSERRGFQLQFYHDNTLPRDACRVTLDAKVPASVVAGEPFSVPYRLRNRAESPLESSYPYRVKVGYRWFDRSGVVECGDTSGTPLAGVLAAGEVSHGRIDVVAAPLPGRYQFRLSAVQEGVVWFDDLDPANGYAQDVLIVAPAPTAEAPLPATVTNVGITGTLLAFPLVAPGEPAILAPGAIVDGRCWLALCYDRARYDEYAADRLLGTIAERLAAHAG